MISLPIYTCAHINLVDIGHYCTVLFYYFFGIMIRNRIIIYFVELSLVIILQRRRRHTAANDFLQYYTMPCSTYTPK